MLDGRPKMRCASDSSVGELGVGAAGAAMAEGGLVTSAGPGVLGSDPGWGRVASVREASGGAFGSGSGVGVTRALEPGV